MEEWKNIIGYEGLYEVSNMGNVRNVRRNTLLRFSKNNYGYIQVYLYKNGIRNGFKVHRLVAQAFIPNPDNLPQVNHKDEDKTNNSVENLEWCDHKYNVNYGHRTENAINTRVKNGYADPNFIGFGLNEKEYIKQYSRIYYERNREKSKERSKIYYQEHKKELYEKNKERTKEWRENNRERYNEWQREYRLKKEKQIKYILKKGD